MNNSIILCSKCYRYNGLLLSSCGCFLCNECLKFYNKSQPSCPNCSKSIMLSKCLDLRSKENLTKIKFIFDDPEVHLKQVIESIKFQKMHKKKYINFLENKIDDLLKENNTLKASYQSSILTSDNIPLNYTTKPQQSYYNTSIESKIYKNNIIDVTQIKRIEPKTAKIQYGTPFHSSSIQVNNLNAQTAGRRVGFDQEKGMLNININSICSNKNQYGSHLNTSFQRTDCSTPNYSHVTPLKQHN